jgi:cellulose synthase (UDP-forming)
MRYIFFLVSTCFIVSVGVIVYSILSSRRDTFYSPHTDNSIGNWLLSIVPRIVMFVFIWLSLLPFIVVLLSYSEEPELWLPDFMTPDNYPTVDVFLPRYKEDWEMYEATILAALNLDYPTDKLVVHVCDDGARSPESHEERVRVMMASHPNLRYHKRSDGLDAKAGNLNNAMLTATGQLLSVLDADHCCKTTFLLRTIPHLLGQWKDGSRSNILCKSTAFVQTTQVFKNENDLLIAVMEGAHGIFYKLVMNGMNGMGVALCVGTGYVMQRTALDSIGGFAKGYAVEDVLTAIHMHGRGWTSKYLECREVIGLSPATLAEFFQQRERWAAGSAQLFVYALWGQCTNLTWGQTIGYVACSSYWFTSIILAIILVLRMATGVTQLFMYNSNDVWIVPILADYLPIITMLALMPRGGPVTKVSQLTAYLMFVPTYLPVIKGLVTGKLNPQKYVYKVQASSEVNGCNWPMAASWNIGFVIVVTILYGLSFLSSFNIYSAPIQYISPTVFIVCTYLVNTGPLLGLVQQLCPCMMTPSTVVAE